MSKPSGRYPAADPAGPGVTLIEILVALTLLVTLLTAGIPLFERTVLESRMRAGANTLITDLHLARQTAVHRGVPVTVCPGLEDACAGGTEWHNGWTVFVDTTRTGDPEPEDDIVAVTPALRDGLTLSAPETRPRIRFQPDGSAWGYALTFTLCDERGAGHARTIILANTGRPRHARTTPSGTPPQCP